MVEETPRWDALPHDPEGFFELEPGGYDRRALKRAYGRLIKKYKPERHPEEFQKIRQAYEELDSQLRYFGTSSVAPTTPTTPADSSGSVDSSTPADSRDDPPIDDDQLPRSDEQPPRRPISIDDGDLLTPELVEQIIHFDHEAHDAKSIEEGLRRDPGEWYDDLKQRPTTPLDFLTLAILSDVTVRDDAGAFFRHLAEGLHQYPHHDGLRSVLFHALRDVELEEPEAILVELGERLPAQLYYHLTEPAWLHLLRDCSFDEFRRTLERAEGGIDDPYSPPRVVFLIRLLRAACFRADQEWIDQTTDIVFDQQGSFAAAFEPDLDFLDVLMQYRAVRQEFLGVKPHPIRERIDRVIRSWCEDPELEAQETFLAAQLEMVEDGRETLKALPYTDEVQYAALVTSYHIAAEMEDVSGVDRTTAADSAVLRQVYDFANRMERVTDRSRFGMIWWLWGMSYVGVLFLGVLLPVLIGGALLPIETMDSNLRTVVILGSIAVWAFVAWKWVRPHLLEPVRMKVAMRIAQSCYRKVWRSELLRFVRSSHLPIDAIQEQLDGLEDDNITNDDWIALLMRDDYGLAFFSLAQRFLH